MALTKEDKQEVTIIFRNMVKKEAEEAAKNVFDLYKSDISTVIPDAIREEISNLRIELKEEIKEIRRENIEIRKEISDIRTETRKEISDLKTEVKADISNLGMKIAKLDGQFRILIGIASGIFIALIVFLVKSFVP